MSIPILLFPLTWWCVASVDTNAGWKSVWWEEDSVYSGLTSPDILHSKLSQHPGIGAFSLEFQRAWEASQHRFLALDQPRTTGPSASLDIVAPVLPAPPPEVPPPNRLVETKYTHELITNPIGPSTKLTYSPNTPAEGVSNSHLPDSLRPYHDGFGMPLPTDSQSHQEAAVAQPSSGGDPASSYTSMGRATDGLSSADVDPEPIIVEAQVLTHQPSTARFSQFHRNRFLNSGRISDPVLKENHRKFRNKLNEKRFHCSRHPRNCVDPSKLRVHYELPFAMVEPAFPDPTAPDGTKILRILTGPTGHLQKTAGMNALYKQLLAALNEHHENALKRSGRRSASSQSAWLKWLWTEMFKPQKSLPLCGIVHAPYPLWTLGEIQVELIKYFAQNPQDNKLLLSTASHLLRAYFKAHDGSQQMLHYV
ncbi:hypothetical protein PGTUg99_010340 [Puccinia graminis f. sp. tritici]|uniref:Uncharacterized protein n=1 Tax=Puccinia graminis f. sp. tritici TaxID=56615 RepID=A0A5B0RZP2_PUCGR|nr:hypothetical protein PGTUg99_010340 [Puccinia graminis f. sp. tritici]